MYNPNNKAIGRDLSVYCKAFLTLCNVLLNLLFCTTYCTTCTSIVYLIKLTN